MDTIEKNKQLVRDFIEVLCALDSEKFLSFLAEDVHLETPGYHPAAGVKTKAQVVQELPAMREMLPNGIEPTELTITAEDDRVGYEWRGKAKTCNGDDYNNVYFYYFQIRDGKIIVLRDYHDSTLVVKLMVPFFEKHGATMADREKEQGS